MNQSQIFTLRLPAEPESLALVRAIVKRAVEDSGCNNDLTQKIVVAVNEACMNVIQHAYGESKIGDFELVLNRTDGKLHFRLTDSADHINLDKVKSRDLEDLKPGGLGIHFIQEIMDDYSYGHLKGHGNYFEMEKTIE